MPCRHMLAALNYFGRLQEMYEFFDPCYTIEIYEKPLRMLCLSKFLLLKNWILMALSCLHLKFLEKEDQESNGSKVGEKESEVRVESALCAPLVGTTE